MVDEYSVSGWDVRWESGTKIISGGTELKQNHKEDEILSLKWRRVWTQGQNRFHSVSERGQGDMCQRSKQNSRLGQKIPGQNKSHFKEKLKM